MRIAPARSGRLARCALLASAVATLGTAPATVVVPAADGVPWTGQEIRALATDVDAVLADPAFRGAHVGLFAIDTARETVVYAHGADDVIQPASTFKLVVGSAALDALGANFRFRTTLALADLPGYASPASSPFALVLAASGDPTFARADLAQGVAALPAGVVLRGASVDDSAFDDVPYPGGWTWDDFGQAYAPRISAATLDENVTTMTVSAGARAGDAPIVHDSDGALVPSVDCISTDVGMLRVRNDARTASAGSADTLDVAPALGACARLVGSIPLDAKADRVDIAVPDPRRAMLGALEAALARTGRSPIEALASGPAALAVAPRADAVHAPFWTHDSAPLAALLGPRFWIPSDNLFAENLLKTLGRVTSGAPGTTANGIAYERMWLRSLGVDPATMSFADGCGMSQYDRVTARDLVTILQHDWNGPNRQIVLDSLPVGGSRGTIEGIPGTAAAGRIFAKTGSMMHVRGLAGYAQSLRHGAVTFAFEIDDWNGAYDVLARARANVLARLVRS